MKQIQLNGVEYNSKYRTTIKILASHRLVFQMNSTQTQNHWGRKSRAGPAMTSPPTDTI